jgi:hypothetical protein
MLRLEVTVTRRVSLMATLSVLVVVGCGSSSDPASAQLSGSMSDPKGSVVVTGDAVDDGVVCSSATQEVVRWEDLDGQSITEEEFDRLFDEAVETGEAVAGVTFVEFTCTDGSGSFLMAQSPTTRPTDLDFDGVNTDVGTWVIDRGTGDYDGLSGEGTIDFDFAAGVWTCPGELEG